uniref:Uncharacterized protein n=1 Tax=Musa acuminata subsp. malaccensis TaxID=214687 RepID=A0A804J7L4_MUSAM
MHLSFCRQTNLCLQSYGRTYLQGNNSILFFLWRKGRRSIALILFFQRLVLRNYYFEYLKLFVELLAKNIIELSCSCFYVHAKMLLKWCMQESSLITQGSWIDFDLYTVKILIFSLNVRFSLDFADLFGHLCLAANLITYKDHFNLYRIEQELGTEIKQIILCKCIHVWVSSFHQVINIVIC